MMHPEQLRTALTALKWKVRDLADKADVNANTVSRLAATGGRWAISAQVCARRTTDVRQALYCKAAFRRHASLTRTFSN